MRVPLRKISCGLCTQMKKNYFYVTTPIYYVNAAPHIGHLYTSLVADTAKRWRQLLDSNLNFIFSTGTDEHGSKIQQAATKQGISLEKYCGDVSDKYRNLSDFFGIDYTRFIRTNDEDHVETVQRFWRKISENGHVLSRMYSGWYCISEETFLVDTQLKESTLADGRKIYVSSESGHPVEWTQELNYIFRLENFRKELLYWLNTGDVVKPIKFKKILLEMISKDEDGLPDISISRPTSRVHWGIKVPGDETQTIYVWLDALVNYLTVAGYGRGDFTWPPDLQVIGKDILKFHGIYWPAFLMAAGLEPPKSLLCHSHWTVEGEKMSKSKKNVICPIQKADVYTADGLRYFLLREGVAHNDGNYSDTKATRILNSELADTLGNLLSRCTGTALNPNQIFPKIKESALKNIAALDVTTKLINRLRELPERCHLHYEEYNYYKVADAIMETLHAANLFFETLKPWELRKENEKENELKVVIHLTLETLRICGILLQPIVPKIASVLLDRINVSKSERNWKDLLMKSWECLEKFEERPLSREKVVLFNRILTEEQMTKRKKG